jgi:hypothetical protein
VRGALFLRPAHYLFLIVKLYIGLGLVGFRPEFVNLGGPLIQLCLKLLLILVFNAHKVSPFRVKLIGFTQ